MNNPEKIILSFDLDNTLIDNRIGIINSFNYALNKFNLPSICSDEIEKMIGIPLDQMFEKISNINPKLLSSTFREYYGKKGIYQAKLIMGVKRKLEEFKEKKFILGVITSKKQEMAIKIVEFLEISNYFDFIIGESEQIKSKLDPNLSKYLINNFPDYKIIIIGDHPKDKALAKNIKAPFIGVLTGNHSANQLKQNYLLNTVIVKSIRDINYKVIISLL